MKESYWYQILVCACMVIIGSILGFVYYKDYVKPKSYIIGDPTYNVEYTKYPIKDYISSDKVLFSQNINDASFKNIDGIATYDYTFDHKEFNGKTKKYMLYVNNYMLNDVTYDAGVISGVHKLKYFSADNTVLKESNIQIDFTFTSLSSKLKVSVPNEDLGLLLNYFKTDNYIITLCESDFKFGIDGNGSHDYEKPIDPTIPDETMCVVEYIVNGDVWQTVEVEKNTVYTVLDAPERTGVTFEGWRVNADSPIISGEITVTEDIQLTAYYILDGESVVPTRNGTFVYENHTLVSENDKLMSFDEWPITESNKQSDGSYKREINIAESYIIFTLHYDNVSDSWILEFDGNQHIYTRQSY